MPGARDVCERQKVFKSLFAQNYPSHTDASETVAREPRSKRPEPIVHHLISASRRDRHYKLLRKTMSYPGISATRVTS